MPVVACGGPDGPPPVQLPPRPPGATPRCSCGEDAARATVSRDTPNKGRAYFHCAERRCGFFAWADGEQRERDRPPLTWERMPQTMAIVSDFGFRAQDLTQGGVGDCWFMSALAVVADRHDLIARLFASTERNAGAGGVHLLRLFLDGAWRSVHVSDELPCSPAPRRAQLAGPHRLAFCRCADGATGAPQLWASLIEKAYAKAHGSFNAISGGMVAEALLDLTGYPTEVIEFSAGSFDSELLWARLKAYRQLELPMGCGTESAVGSEELREVGLVGHHAYSLIDVREARRRDGERVRLLRIRNPHGVGEWNGAWSDASAEWADLVGGGAGGGGGEICSFTPRPHT